MRLLNSFLEVFVGFIVNVVWSCDVLVVEVFFLLPSLWQFSSTLPKCIPPLTLNLSPITSSYKSSWLTYCILHLVVENWEPYQAYGSLLDWVEYWVYPPIFSKHIERRVPLYPKVRHHQSYLLTPVGEGPILLCVSILGYVACCIWGEGIHGW